MTTRPEIDASAADLDLRMTEGDPMAFNFLVKDAAAWGGATFACEVKSSRSVTAPVIASLAVTVTVEAVTDLDVLLESAPVAGLTAAIGRYWWDMQEVGGMTRFSGEFHVMPQVTDA